MTVIQYVAIFIARMLAFTLKHLCVWIQPQEAVNMAGHRVFIFLKNTGLALTLQCNDNTQEAQAGAEFPNTQKNKAFMDLSVITV